MLLVSLVQIACSIVAVWFGSRTAMAAGRDLRADLFHRVGSFSGREMARFGAAVADHPRHQRRAAGADARADGRTMGATVPIMMVGGILMAMREDLGLSWLLAVVVPALLISVGIIVSRMVPNFRLVQERIDAVNRVLREQITGIRVVRAFVREPLETERFRRTNDELTDVSVTGRPLAGGDVPGRDADREPLQRGRALVRRAPGRQRGDADRLADRVPLLPDADPDVGDDGHLRADDGAAVVGVRRPHHRGARHRLHGGPARRAGHRARPATATSTSTASGSPTRAPTSRC